MRVRSRLPKPALLALVPVVLAAVVAAGQISAQSPREAGAAYLNAVMLREGDAPGYRQTASTVLPQPTIGDLAGQLVEFEANPPAPLRVTGFWIWGFVLPDEQAASAYVEQFTEDYTYTETDGDTVVVTPVGPVTGVEQGYAYRFQRFFPRFGGQAGAGVVWRRGQAVFRISSYGVPNLDWLPETIRLASLQNQRVLSQSPFMAPTATPVTTAMPTPAATPTTVMTQPSGSGSFRVSGSVGIDGDPAPIGATITAAIGSTECGRARVVQRGQYVLDVADAARTPGCGMPGAMVRLTVTPPFGDGWTLNQAIEFLPGGSRRVDIDVDLTTLPPDPAHVPLFPRYWPDPRAVLISPCSTLSDETAEAASIAIAMWDTARKVQGLKFGLDLDEDACLASVSSIVIGEVNWEDEPETLGAHVAYDFDMQECALRPAERCDVYTSVVVINRAARKSADTSWANVLAHEIGHALGLDHAPRCNGQTIMFDDAICRYPRRAIGVDDIAALNRRANEYPQIAAYRAVDALTERTFPGVALPATDTATTLEEALARRGIDPATLRNGERLVIGR